MRCCASYRVDLGSATQHRSGVATAWVLLSSVLMHSCELARVLGLEEVDNDVFRGPGMRSEVFVRMFGGHLAAQALMAASKTVVDGKRVHSLHSYFLRGGAAGEETIYRVHRLRDGRSYSARSIEAYQGDELCYVMNASFHHHLDEGPEHREPMPPVTAPDAIARPTRIPTGVPGAEKDFREWDIRLIPPNLPDQPKPKIEDPSTVSGQSLWFRFTGELPDSDEIHTGALAYMSDMTLLYSAMAAHPGHRVQLASLDHAMWFFRPVRVTDWLLYHQASPAAGSGRALTHGRIFTARGDLVALVAQEGVVRNLRQGATQVPVRGG